MTPTEKKLFEHHKSIKEKRLEIYKQNKLAEKERLENYGDKLNIFI